MFSRNCSALAVVVIEEGDAKRLLMAVMFFAINGFVASDLASIVDSKQITNSKYPPAKPGALFMEPLKAAFWGR